MKILLVYPEFPDTFWSFKHALKFISKKAALPPLGLLSVAAMLPENWDIKLVDMSVEKLKEKDILLSDYVFISAMQVQKESVKAVIKKCKELKAKIVAGGPLFTSDPGEFIYIDHLILNEAELTLPEFLKDLEKEEPKKVYTYDGGWAEVGKTPVPVWNLIKMKKYASMSIQYSRGCPFNCEFCDVTALFGNNIRTKTKEQIIAEMEELYQRGWRGNVFIVDDNFIGNKNKLKKKILPAIIEWNKNRKYPFIFNTQVSINLADDEDIMEMMVLAGFDKVFIGIETPNKDSLAECSKYQNRDRDLLTCIKKIQRHGLEVQGGFIVGFDSDTISIFEILTEFIQKSGVVTAMVGLLNAPKGTKLYQRLLRENRLTNKFSGNNTDFTTNFKPVMSYEKLVNGYRNIINNIYSSKNYYERIKEFLKNYEILQKKHGRVHILYISALMKSIWLLGIKGKERIYYWKLFFWSLFHKPKLFPRAITMAIYGFHFRMIFGLDLPEENRHG